MELKGLSDEEVKVSRKRYGNNVVSENKQNSFLSLLIESLGDPIIKILLIFIIILRVFIIIRLYFITNPSNLQGFFH